MNKNILSIIVCTLINIFAVSSVYADEGLGTYLRLGLGAGALDVHMEEDSPVLGLGVKDDTIPTVSIWVFPGEELISMLPLAKHFSVETELGVTTHSLRIGGAKVGEVSSIPLNFSLQMHPWVSNFPFISKNIDPFVGLGFNRTYFTKQNTPGVDGLEPTLGLLFHGGVNYWVTDRIFLQADIRKLWIDQDLRTGGGSTAGGGTKIENIDLDPLAVGVSFGFKF